MFYTFLSLGIFLQASVQRASSMFGNVFIIMQEFFGLGDKILDQSRDIIMGGSE